MHRHQGIELEKGRRLGSEEEPEAEPEQDTPEEESKEEEPPAAPKRVKFKKKIKPRNVGSEDDRPRLKSSKLKKKGSGERPKLKRRR